VPLTTRSARSGRSLRSRRRAAADVVPVRLFLMLLRATITRMDIRRVLGSPVNSVEGFRVGPADTAKLIEGGAQPFER